MSTVIAPVDRVVPVRPRVRRRERRLHKRLLRRQDALSGRLAELQAIGALLDQAAEVVRGGWVQDAWFTVAMAGGTRAVTAYDLGLVTQYPVVGACLVGSVVQAAGGPGTVRSQLVQRTLDVTWHALREESAHPVQWCPGPPVRALRLLDLTLWNDARERTQDDVVGLLHRARREADEQRTGCRAEQARLAVTRESLLAS